MEDRKTLIAKLEALCYARDLLCHQRPRWPGNANRR